jgi:diguanylate cyclase (GGDEF)-like protein
MARLSARLQETAHTDTLTGLPNRRHMTERIAAEHDRLDNGTGDGYALIEADLDDFKGVNDRYGHAAGDRLLARIGERLARGLRERDVLSRWGGEEFLVLLPATGMAEAAAVAERVRALVARDPVSIDGQRIAVTVSIGIARAERGDSVDNVLQRTDRRMYAAKDRGRDAVVSEDG